MLILNNVEVIYSDVILVLRAVSFTVGDDGIIAVLGSNGAGKSTTLKAISGLLKPERGKVTHGSIEFNNTRIDNMGPTEIARLGIMQVLEGRQVLEHLTVEENLLAGTAVRHGRGAINMGMAEVYQYFPILESMRRRVSGYLSGGEQQMLVIGRALMANPKLMMLDEPSLGLAPLMITELFGIIKRLSTERQAAILLVEQNTRIALAISDHGYVMENGKVVMDGPADKLRENRDIQEFYMGLSALGKKSYRDVKHYKRRKRWL